MRIEIPDFCLVALVGASGSGKSTFGRTYFKPTEVLSSDFFRGLVADDESDQSATSAAFDCLHYVAGKRLEAGRLTVVDATNVQKGARAGLLRLAREHDCFAVAIVLDTPTELCLARNESRPDRNFHPGVVQRHVRDLKASLKHLTREGFRFVHVVKNPDEEVEIVRKPLWNDRRHEHGPFDVIGDIHGCHDELCALLEKLGYTVDRAACAAMPPSGRRAVFLGDYCDRGPANVKTLRLVMNMVESGAALALPGNHDMKLLKHLQGGRVTVSHGLDLTLAEFESQPPEFIERVKKFLNGLISHYVLDDGKLVAAHAGLTEKYQGRGSGRVRNFCLFGETTGEIDEFGLPVRLNWADEYRGQALVLYGHVPSVSIQKLNNSIGLDTGCVFGGRLSAWRYPEQELVDVPAARVYYEPIKPLGHDRDSRGDLLNIADVAGKRRVSTRLLREITVYEENSAAALEIMSRFAADPRWLIYLPPTMSPCETSPLDDYLEHPREAFAYYRKHGVETVVCEQKHMGSRAVVLLCRDEGVAAQRFHVDDGSIGLLHTRTGRHFFDEREAHLERAILERLGTVLNKNGFWEKFATDWVCLDAELMPWSAKARELVRRYYAPVGHAGVEGLGAGVEALARAAERLNNSSAADDAIDLTALIRRFEGRRDKLGRYVEAWRAYCWPVNSLDDYRLAPFHILATEGRVWHDADHLQHMRIIAEHIAGDPLFLATEHRAVNLGDAGDLAAAENWWLTHTESGGEGMVVKPLNFIQFAGQALLQPAVKCRGREYLRIIYGPEYDDPEHLVRLKKRALNKKRRLALQEFALGMESLERFVNNEPLYRVHECVFAVLAMESEPVDPRL